MTVLVLGATGFVGSNLTSKLLREGQKVRVLARDPSKLTVDSSHLEIYTGDLLRPETLRKAFEGVTHIYYLVHAMASSDDYEELEKEQATNVSELLTSEHTIIYLSGLASGELSKHMRSRQHVGDLLRDSPAKVIEFRASIVIGRGSASFEMINAIVSRFPVIIESSWGRARCQPIAIDDLVQYLIAAQELQEPEIIEIGGTTKLTYVDLLKLCAELKGLHRPTLRIEHFPKEIVLKAMEIFLPEYYEVGKKLFSSIELDSVVTTKGKRLIKRHHSLEAALKKALEKSEKIQQVSLEEFFEWTENWGSKHPLPPMELVEKYMFKLSIPFNMAKNLLAKFVAVFKITPFKTSEITQEQFDGDLVKLGLRNIKGPKFEIAVHLFPVDHQTHIEMLTRYHAQGFIDSASYMAFKSFGEKWSGKITQIFGR